MNSLATYKKKDMRLRNVYLRICFKLCLSRVIYSGRRKLLLNIFSLELHRAINLKQGKT